MNWLDSAFERHKAARRIALMWAMCLITYATHQIFSDISEITAPAAGAYATVTGLLTVVVGLYQWSRARDDKSEQR